MKKILACLQYYSGDQAIARQVARLIADLEPDKSKYADFMFAMRWDGQHDMETVQYVARKFDQVHTFKSERKNTGWPSAPNNLALETYGRFCLRIRQKLWDYAALLLIEPDCVPLTRDWLKQLHEEWHEREQLVLGFMYGSSAHPVQHINGNCLISPRFQKVCPDFHASPATVGWDVRHAPAMLRHGRASRLIWNDYARQSISCEELFAAHHYADDHPLHGRDIFPVLFHGVKDDSALRAVREKFNLPPL